MIHGAEVQQEAPLRRERRRVELAAIPAGAEEARLPDPAHPGTAPTAVPAGTAVPVGTAVPAGTAAAPVAPPPSPVVTTWEVRPGQSLWKIARDVESLRRGRAATDGEVCAYWRSLIEVNRDLLADPRNPHLVFTGQLFRLPPLSPP